MWEKIRPEYRLVLHERAYRNEEPLADCPPTRVVGKFYTVEGNADLTHFSIHLEREGTLIHVVDPETPEEFGERTGMKGNTPGNWKTPIIPKNHPKHANAWQLIPGSERTIEPHDNLAYTLIEALSRDEIVGKSAERAASSVFWTYIAGREMGIDYLQEFVPPSARHFASMYCQQTAEPYSRDREDHERRLKQVHPGLTAFWNARDSKTEFFGYPMYKVFKAGEKDKEIFDTAAAIASTIEYYNPSEQKLQPKVDFSRLTDYGMATFDVLMKRFPPKKWKRMLASAK